MRLRLYTLPALAVLLLACEPEPDGFECEVYWDGSPEPASTVWVEEDTALRAEVKCGSFPPRDSMDFPLGGEVRWCFVWEYQENGAPLPGSDCSCECG
jgi:hypothetical protein